MTATARQLALEPVGVVSTTVAAIIAIIGLILIRSGLFPHIG